MTNRITWRLRSPGDPPPVEVGSGSPALDLDVPAARDYTLTCEVAADTNFIKPQVEGANVTSRPGPSRSAGGLQHAARLRRHPPPSRPRRLRAGPASPSSGTRPLRRRRRHLRRVTRDGLPLASGLTGLSYLDHPGDGADHVYRVRAVTHATAAAQPGPVAAPRRATSTAAGVAAAGRATCSSWPRAGPT